MSEWCVRAETDRLLGLLAKASVALSPFGAFADEASGFVDSAARGLSGASVLPTNHFRLHDFLRAREISAEIEAALAPGVEGPEGGLGLPPPALRAENARLRDRVSGYSTSVEANCREIERLETANDALRAETARLRAALATLCICIGPSDLTVEKRVAIHAAVKACEISAEEQ